MVQKRITGVLKSTFLLAGNTVSEGKISKKNHQKVGDISSNHQKVDQKKEIKKEKTMCGRKEENKPKETKQESKGKEWKWEEYL